MKSNKKEVTLTGIKKRYFFLLVVLTFMGISVAFFAGNIHKVMASQAQLESLLEQPYDNSKDNYVFTMSYEYFKELKENGGISYLAKEDIISLSKVICDNLRGEDLIELSKDEDRLNLVINKIIKSFIGDRTDYDNDMIRELHTYVSAIIKEVVNEYERVVISDEFLMQSEEYQKENDIWKELIEHKLEEIGKENAIDREAISKEINSQINAATGNTNSRVDALAANTDSRLNEVADAANAANTRIDAVEGGVNAKIDAVAGGVNAKIDAAMGSTNARVDELYNELSSQIAGGKDNLNAIKDDINVIQGNVNTLQGEVSAMQGNINGLQGDVGVMQGNINGLQGDINSLKDIAAGLGGRIDDAEMAIKILQQNNQENGNHYELPNGLKIQWGTFYVEAHTPYPNVNTWINFDVEYTGEYSIVFTRLGAASMTYSTSVKEKNNNGFEASVHMEQAGGGATTYQWMAIGY